MGVDISGRKPTTEQGQYFRSNWWNWRPILVCCKIMNDKLNLKYDMEYWGSNDGEGLRTQKQCNKLADALEGIAAALSSEESKCTVNNRFGVNLGCWNTEDGKFVDDDNTSQLNQQFTTAFLPPSVEFNGKTYRPSYQTDIEHLQNFITFLRSCGGFKIW